MDPHEEKVAKLYITSILSLIALVLMLGTVAKLQEGNLATPLSASTQNSAVTK